MKISTVKLTPSIYSRESRDYQLISRLYDAVFNHSKMNADAIEHLPLSKNSDDRLLDLVAKTLGFESKHNYNTNNLFALVSSFKKIMFHKGTIEAIKECVSMLLKSQNIDKLFIVNVDKENYAIQIFVPTQLKDIVLLEDMMSYILPAGFVYEIYVRDIGEKEVKEKYIASSTQISIEGTSQQLSAVQSYVNASLVTGLPVAGTDDVVDNMKSGKQYIDEQYIDEYSGQ